MMNRMSRERAFDVNSAITWPEGSAGLAPRQPVIALDFDGVLNVTVLGGRDAPVPEGFTRRTTELDKRNWPTHPYIRPLPLFSSAAIVHPIVTSAAHLRMVDDWLRAGAAVIWATTWERAIRRPASEVGLPDLPVLEMSVVPMAEQPQRTALWKLEAITTVFAGHPLVWVDDFAGDWVDQHSFGDPATPFLAVAPDEYVGLTTEQSDAVTAFVRAHGG